jgi:hypothetical protein
MEKLLTISRKSPRLCDFRHNRADRLERRLGWAVGRGTGVQHRAEAGRYIDDLAQGVISDDSVGKNERYRRMGRDKAASLIGRGTGRNPARIELTYT